MIRITVFCLLAALAFGCSNNTDSVGDESPIATDAAAKEDRIFDFPYVQRDLDNGLRVIVVPTDYPDIVSLQIPVQTGSRNEVEKGKSGFAHFFEHMMFRGTEAYPSAVYNEIVKNAGGDQSGYTTDDYTNYHITFTKQDLEKIIEIEADRFMNLKYGEAEFRTEALAVKGEYLKNNSNPINKILERARDLGFDKHPYEHTTMGFLADIENMPEQKDYADIFFDRWYRPEKSVIILVGEVEPESAIALIEKYWGSWERGDFSVEIPAEPAPKGPAYEHLHWETPTQPWLTISHRGPAYVPTAGDMPAMDVISEIYFSESSELYQELVIQRQLVDELFTYFPDRKDSNLLLIGARLTNASHAVAVRDAIYETLTEARTQAPLDEKLAETISRLRYRLAARLDSSGSIAATLASFVHFERTPETINEVYRSYAALTPEDIRRYANDYFVDRSRVMVALSNDDSMPGIDGSASLDDLVQARSVPENTLPVAMLATKSASAPLVDINLLFDTGAAFDPAGKKGIAYLTAQMIADGGSSARSIEEISSALYPLAASFDAQVGKEMTRFQGTVHRDNVDAWLTLVGPQLLDPGWRESDLSRIKTQTINAIRTGLVGNNDEELAKELLYEEIYGADHPYGTLTLGDVSDIDSITIDDLKAFYREHYTIANLTTGLMGGFDDDFKRRLDAELGALGIGVPADLVVAEAPPQNGRDALIVEKDTLSVAVSFGHPISLRRGDKDWVALWLARSWLGEHRSFNSHLFQRIREERGMNYGNYAYVEYFPNGMFLTQPPANLGRQQQIFQVWIRPLRSNNDAVFATRAALFELDKLIRDGLSEEQFESTRNYLGKYVSLLTENQSRQLAYSLDGRYYETGKFSDYIRGELSKLTLDDVNRVVAEHLSTENLQFIFVARDADELQRLIETDAASPISYNAEKDDALLAEDAVIQRQPLEISPRAITRANAADLFE